LCAGGGTVYSFASTPEATSTAELSNTEPGAAGLAFTTTSIGGGQPVVYAPVAITATTLGFHIDGGPPGQKFKEQHVNLTPELLAKTLTQSYSTDVPGQPPRTSWAGSAFYLNISADPAWISLNPNDGNLGSMVTQSAPLETADLSTLNQQVWTWVQSDPGTRSWLRGQPDAKGMVVNPSYKALHLGYAPPANSYPRADPTCFYQKPTDKGCVTSLNILAYMNSLDDVAVQVQRNNTGATAWDPTKQAVDGSFGDFVKVSPRPAGQRFVWGLTATANAAQYGLQAASLCQPDGGGCVAPSVNTLRAAVDAATPDTSGMLHVDPANPGLGGYPLTQIVYAAVRTNQDSAALRDDATLLDYAAGAGQSPGTSPGQLPPGYLPLPDALRRQAEAVADTLRADAAARPQGPASVAPTSGPSGSNGPTGKPSGAPHDATNNAPHPAASNNPHGPDNQPQGNTGLLPTELSAKATPRQSLGALRWALLGVLIAGLAGALVGPMIKHPPRLARLLRWLP